MATDQRTHPIAPNATDRHLRWPLVNDLEDNPIEVRPMAAPEMAGENRRTGYGSPDWLDVARAEGPLPAVGDMWGREVLDAPLVAGPVIARPHTAGPVSYPRTRTTPAATASMVCGLAAVPLTVALGLGGLLGVVAVVLGVVSIRTIRREPGCRGTGQALTGVVLGTGSAVIGLPILAAVLMVGALF